MSVSLQPRICISSFYSPKWTALQPLSLAHDGSLEPEGGWWELKREKKKDKGQVELKHQEPRKAPLSVDEG